MSKIDKALCYLSISLLLIFIFFTINPSINTVSTIFIVIIMIGCIASGINLIYQLEKATYIRQTKRVFRQECEKRLMRLRKEDQKKSFETAASEAYESIFLQSSKKVQNIIQSGTSKKILCGRMADNIALHF